MGFNGVQFWARMKRGRIQFQNADIRQAGDEVHKCVWGKNVLKA
jgi:hypothetical protein